MIFLNPLLLWGILAVSLPILIHLINRRRHQTIAWAAMQFLLKAARQSRGKKKLRHIAILTCRALAIAALCFAAARPVASHFMGWGGGTIDTVVLLLDRSASMEIQVSEGGPTKRERVLEQVRSALGDLGSPRLVLIDSASKNPQEVPSSDALLDLSATAPTESAADFPGLLLRAAEALMDRAGRSEIWLASDMQSSNWLPEDERWAAARASLAALPSKPAIRVLSMSSSVTSNVSIKLLETQRMNRELILNLEISRDERARGAVSIPLTRHMNGAATTQPVQVQSQTLRFQQKVPIADDQPSGFGWLTIPADGNLADNSVYFAYGPKPAVSSMVVSAPGEAAEILSLAAAPPGYEGQTTQRIEPSAIASTPLHQVAAIFWLAPIPKDEGYLAMNRFLSDGGHVMFFPAGEASDTGFVDFKWSEPSVADTEKFFILKDWDTSDGLLRDGKDGSAIPAGKLKAIRRQIPLGEAAPMARWDDGEAFLTRRIMDHGTAWFMGTRPEYNWSNLGDADVLLPAVQRVLEGGSERFSISHQAFVGEPASQLAPGEIRARLDLTQKSDPANAAYLTGIYRLGTRVLAINRPPAEDRLERVDQVVLNEILQNTGFTLLDQAGQTSDANLSRDVWRAFIIAMLLFLLVEAMLCLPSRTPVEPKLKKSTA